MSSHAPKLNPPYDGPIEVPPPGTATSAANGAAVIVPAEWLRQIDSSGVRPGELRPLLDALDDDDGAGYMVSIVKKRSGIGNTLFASTKGGARHAPRIKIAIDPPNSFDESTAQASMALHDFGTVGAYMPPKLVEQVKAFIELNRDALLAYWEGKLDTESFLEQLKPVQPK